MLQNKSDDTNVQVESTNAICNFLCSPSLETEVVEANDLDESINNQTKHSESDMDLDQSTFSLEDDSLTQEGSKFESNSLKVFAN